MSPVIYEPPEPHDCQPPTRRIGYDGATATAPAYRTNTIWACDDCGQRWIVEAEIHGKPSPYGTCRGWIVRSWWTRHDKDTP